jgi:hypothetical protein
VQAKAAIVEQVERLRWRTWNGKARNARLTAKLNLNSDGPISAFRGA